MREKAKAMRTVTPINRPSRQQQFEEVKTRIHSKLVDKLDLARVGDLKGDCEDWKKAAELDDEDAAVLVKENCQYP